MVPRVSLLEPPETRPPVRWAVGLLSMVGIVLLAYLDFHLQRCLSLSIFYAVFLFLSTWYVGPLAGSIAAVASAFFWTLVDWHLHVPAQATQAHMVWNLLLRTVFFLSIVFVLHHWKITLLKLKQQALRDPLTGLLNLRGFFLLAEHLLGRARRTHEPLTLVFLDVDNLKAINDARGHLEGDRLLRSLGDLLAQSFRRSDVLARIGGDEFLLLFEGADGTTARRLVEKLRKRIQELRRQLDLPLTCSMGVATFYTPPPSVEAMIREADRLMYGAKTREKNQVFYASY